MAGLFGGKTKEPKGSMGGWAQEEAERNRVKQIHRLSLPTANLFMARLLKLGLLGLVGFQEVRIWRMDSAIKDAKPVIIRVNDVGRAEMVRMDGDYIPEEPDLRHQIIELTSRMFSRNGFTLPEAIQKNYTYLLGESFETWVKQARQDLKLVSKGQNLKRVRLLYLHIDNVRAAKSPGGTRAWVRFATDDQSENGAVLPGSAHGYEAVLDFRIGDYPKISEKEDRKNWWAINPLGLRVFRYSVYDYRGSDVALQDGMAPNVIPVDLPNRTQEYAPGSVADIQTLSAEATALQPAPNPIPIKR